MTKIRFELPLMVYGTYTVPGSEPRTDLFLLPFVTDFSVKKRQLPVFLHSHVFSMGDLRVFKNHANTEGPLHFNTNNGALTVTVFLSDVGKHFKLSEYVFDDNGCVLRFDEGSASFKNLEAYMYENKWALDEIRPAPIFPQSRRDMLLALCTQQKQEEPAIDSVWPNGGDKIWLQIHTDDRVFYIKGSIKAVNPKKGTVTIRLKAKRKSKMSPIDIDLPQESFLANFQFVIYDDGGTWESTMDKEGYKKAFGPGFGTDMILLGYNNVKIKDGVKVSKKKEVVKKSPSFQDAVSVTLDSGGDSYTMTGTISLIDEEDGSLILIVKNPASKKGETFRLVISESDFNKYFVWKEGWYLEVGHESFLDIFDEEPDTVLDVLWPVKPRKSRALKTFDKWAPVAQPVKKKGTKKKPTRPEVGDFVSLECTFDDEKTWHTLDGEISSVTGGTKGRQGSVLIRFSSLNKNKAGRACGTTIEQMTRSFSFDAEKQTWSHNVDEQEYKDLFNVSLKDDLKTLDYLKPKKASKKKQVKTVGFELTVGIKKPFTIEGQANIVPEFGHVKIFYEYDDVDENDKGTKVIPMAQWKTLFGTDKHGDYIGRVDKKTFDRWAAE